MNLFFIILISAQNPVELYNQGNSYYNSKDYQSAITCYEQALELGLNKDIYYNLGNAYFKLNKIGRAIIQYQRARLIAPRDNDIIDNLNFARNYRADKITILENPIGRLLSQTFHYFSITESYLWAAIFFLVSAILISLDIIYQIRNLRFGLIFTLLTFLYFLITFMVWNSEKSDIYGVITQSEVRAYSGPGEEYKEILIIHDGAEVKIRDERNGYYLTQLPGGIGAWVKSTTIKKVFQ